MQADIDNLGTSFLKLARIRDTDLREDVIAYEGGRRDTWLLDCYTLEYTEDGDCVYSEDLGTVTLVRVDCLAVMGESYGGGVRCYERDITAYKDAAGTIWMDAELHDEVFC